MTKQVLEKFKSLTFISGTLTFNHSFKAFQNWFNEDIDFNTFEISTPLTSSNHTNVLCPMMLKRTIIKNLDDYVASIVDYIVEYITVTQSKCLVLFTSYKMMHMVQDLLNELPELEDYVILTQQQNQNYKIVQQFNNFDKSILLGTSTFLKVLIFKPMALNV